MVDFDLTECEFVYVTVFDKLCGLLLAFSVGVLQIVGYDYIVIFFFIFYFFFNLKMVDFDWRKC